MAAAGSSEPVQPETVAPAAAVFCFSTAEDARFS
jgi:hypothetical protein